MINSIIGILVGIIILLVGLVISIFDNFQTDYFWVGIVLFFVGIGIVTLFILGKIKKWF